MDSLDIFKNHDFFPLEQRSRRNDGNHPDDRSGLIWTEQNVELQWAKAQMYTRSRARSFNHKVSRIVRLKHNQRNRSYVRINERGVRMWIYRRFSFSVFFNLSLMVDRGGLRTSRGRAHRIEEKEVERVERVSDVVEITLLLRHYDSRAMARTHARPRLLRGFCERRNDLSVMLRSSLVLFLCFQVRTDVHSGG
nr:hypothetical protein CFP56_71757 [Quercus suber]